MFNLNHKTMSKFNEAMAKYTADLAGMGGADEALLTKVAKGLGPSIYLKDASLVSCTDQTELDRVKNNFLIKKMGMSDDAAMDAAIKAVCEQYKGSRNKHRAVFYYLLVKNLGLESKY